MTAPTFLGREMAPARVYGGPNEWAVEIAGHQICVALNYGRGERPFWIAALRLRSRHGDLTAYSDEPGDEGRNEALRALEERVRRVAGVLAEAAR